MLSPGCANATLAALIYGQYIGICAHARSQVLILVQYTHTVMHGRACFALKAFVTFPSAAQVLILDEADQLLEMGFRKDLTKIIERLPKHRQTLLFSATVPPAVHQVKNLALAADHVFVDTVGESAAQTHTHVQQDVLTCDLPQLNSCMEAMLTEHMRSQTAKVRACCLSDRSRRLVPSVGAPDREAGQQILWWCLAALSRSWRQAIVISH
jgi:hypothetical protein